MGQNKEISPDLLTYWSRFFENITDKTKELWQAQIGYPLVL